MSKTVNPDNHDNIWDFPEVPSVNEEPPFDPEYDTVPAPKAEVPVKKLDLEADVVGGQIELSIPGDTFNNKFGAVRITLPLKNAHQLPGVVEAILADTQRAFDAANKYADGNRPAARPSGVAAGGYAAQVQIPQGAPQAAPAGMPVAGTGAAAVAGLASGQFSPAGLEAGMMQVQGQYGLLTFPRRDALSSQDFTAMAQQLCAEQLGINAAYVICFDNRKDLEAGDTRSGHAGVIRLSKVAPVEVMEKFVTKAGRPAAVAWVDWDLMRMCPKVSITKDYRAIEAFVKPALVGA